MPSVVWPSMVCALVVAMVTLCVELSMRLTMQVNDALTAVGSVIVTLLFAAFANIEQFPAVAVSLAVVVVNAPLDALTDTPLI
jgi:hypothetical protein